MQTNTKLGTTTTALNYGAPDLFKKRTVRYLFLLATIMTLGLAAFFCRSQRHRIWSEVQLRYYQYQCGTYLFPRNSIIFDSSKPLTFIDRGTLSSGTEDPRVLKRLEALYGYLKYSTAQETDLVFLHSLGVSPNRLPTAVYVSFRSPDYEQWLRGSVTPGICQIEFFGVSFGDKSWAWMLEQWDSPVAAGYLNASTVRIFNAVPDPNDPSKFRLKFLVDGKEGEIEGRVASDAKIHLRMLSGRNINSLKFPEYPDPTNNYWSSEKISPGF